MSFSSNATTNVTGEASESNSNNYPPNSKRPRNDSGATTTRFKGVVGQINGHWGAQIYANHERIWLGTFKSETEAAMAYDSAAIKLRNGDSFRNLPLTSVTAQEQAFQGQFSTDAILSMIKDGSYVSKFADFLNAKQQISDLEADRDLAPVLGHGAFSCRQLFQKELTPSDVGKLNRLVIPKKSALKHFPPILGSEVEKEGGEQDDVQLSFYDMSMRLWKFRYCYWKSSQSFVFTRGWNKFVMEKQLKPNDLVIFSRCECRDRENGVSIFCMVDVKHNERVESAGVVLDELEENIAGGSGEKAADEESEEGGELVDPSAPNSDDKKVDSLPGDHGGKLVHAGSKGLRLFGVQIV